MRAKPCPVCGGPAQIVHVMDGRDYQPLRGTHPEIWCPCCKGAHLCQCNLPDVEDSYRKPWTALQMVSRWNAGQARRLAETEVHLLRNPANRRRLFAALRRDYGLAACPPDSGWVVWLASEEAASVRERVLAEIQRVPTQEELETRMRVARDLVRRYRRALLELAKDD